MKNLPSYEDFLNERKKLNYWDTPQPNVENEFTETLMNLWNECDSLADFRWNDDELPFIAPRVLYSSLQEDVAEILNKDDFSKWTEKDLAFFVKKVSSYYKPKFKADEIWDEFESRSWEIEDYKRQISEIENEIITTRRNMEAEAGQKGDEWTDADANEYGSQLNDLEKRLSETKEKITYKFWEKKIIDAGNKVSKEIIKKLKDL